MQHPEQRVGIFIDVQNMYYSARNLFDSKVNFGAIVSQALADRKLVRSIAYVVRTKTREEQPFFDALMKVGIETKEKELLEYLGGQKKADWDVGITVDAIRMSDILDVVVLVSGDGDYVPLLEYLKSHGRQTEVISFRETTSTKLVEAADIYTNLSELRNEVLITNHITAAKAHSPRIKRQSTQAPDDNFAVLDDRGDRNDNTDRGPSMGVRERWPI